MLVVALGVTAELVVPRLLQAQRVEEYSALVGELRQTVSEQAHPHTTLHAATALTYVRHTEGLSVVQAVAALRDTDEPMLPGEQVERLGQAGVNAADKLGAVEKGAAPADGAHEVLTLAYVEVKGAEEQARAAAQEAGDEVPEAVLAASLADLSVEQAVELLASPVAPEEVTTVADEDVTDEIIVELQETLAVVNGDIEVMREEIDSEAKRQEFVSETVAGMLPVIQETVAAIDDYLAAVEHAAAKAKEDIAERTSLAAMNARDNAAGDDIAQIQGRIAAYVVAGEASLESHAAVVKAEEEAEAKRKAEEEAAKRKSSAGSGGGGSCLKYVSTWYGSSRLVTVPCR